MHFSMACGNDRPEGYFYAAQDADSFTNPAESEPEEGAFGATANQNAVYPS